MDSALRRHLLLIEFYLLVLIVIGVFSYGQLVPQSGYLGLGLIGLVGILYLAVYDSTG
ncbi:MULTISPECIES: hypothetical protein [Haloferax]|uniref:hypothetical protein n=1 Tax=Haloferax TaxID=2251 RepID=UPI000AE869F8|nr:MULTISPECIES: hypothetical protein [Haloferax]MCO8265141.1 hypothetical protein [Haloferax sp. AB510]